MKRIIQFLINRKRKLTPDQEFVEDLGIQQAIAQFHKNMASIEATMDRMVEPPKVLLGKIDDYEKAVDALRQTATTQEAIIRQRILEEGLIQPLPKELIAQRKHKKIT